MKHDGFRALAHIVGHNCELRSRNGHTFKHWPQLCEEVAHAVKAHDAVIDGEIVCLDRRGRSNFNNLLFRRDWPYLYACDLLAVDGEDLRDWPLIERKRRLRLLIPSVPRGCCPYITSGSGNSVLGEVGIRREPRREQT